MAVQRTLSIIKPDAIAKNVIGDIIRRFEENGLSVIAVNMTHLSRTEAGRFYAVHAERPFYSDLCEFMSSGPILAMALEGKNAVKLNRQLMGATNPKEAETGSIRADHADSIDANAVHGSDSEENAAIEIAFFFSDLDVLSRP
jgi:nucleoside-diphosphate kinase